MSDLEERIFQQNVPGRWSSFETGERSDLRSEDQSDVELQSPEPAKSEDQLLFDAAKWMHSEGVPESISKSILAARVRKHSTGVKGVLADYQAACEMESAVRQAELLSREAVIRRIVEGSKRPIDEATQEEINLNEGLLNEDEEEDSFIRNYRQKRLLELMQSKTKKTFGFCVDVDSDQYLARIDGEDPSVLVIVHLFEPSVQECVLMNRILDELCSVYPHYLFLRLKASDNNIDVDRRTLPILSVYRGGEAVCVMAGINAEFQGRFTRADIEWLLESNLQTHGLQ